MIMTRDILIILIRHEKKQRDRIYLDIRSTPYFMTKNLIIDSYLLSDIHVKSVFLSKPTKYHDR